MAHYAFLDENNVVTEVITGVDEHIVQTDTDGTQVGGSSEAWETWYGNFRGQVCKRTSYNGTIRKHYAGIGFTYDADKDVFIPPKPYSAWVLNEDSYTWEAPIPYPTDGKSYQWSDDDLAWKEAE
jgi:hypothetical protein